MAPPGEHTTGADWMGVTEAAGTVGSEAPGRGHRELTWTTRRKSGTHNVPQCHFYNTIQVDITGEVDIAYCIYSPIST